MILGFIAVAALLVWFLNKTKPIAEEKQIFTAKPLVEVSTVRYGSTTIQIPAKGIVQPKKRTQLAAEVSGKVKWISDKFTTGGQFEEGEIILEMETTDYQSAIVQAEAGLVDAEVALTTEKARASQAARDWQRLGRGRPSALTLREPQIRSANSRLTAAKSSLEKAKKDLDRTIIRSPFNATVSTKSTEIGNFLAPGTPIGEFFQTSPLEVRLPLSLDELQFLNTTPKGEILGDMVISTTLGTRVVEWKARIDRSEGQIDQQSRSVFLISDIVPEEQSNAPIRLQPGLFLNASISGKTFDKVARIPATAFIDLNRIMLVNDKNRLEFRDVSVLRRDDEYVYITDGVNEGERLCLTELSTMIEGTEVEIRELTDNKQAGIQNNLR